MIKPVKWSTHLDLLPRKAVEDIHQASLRILERTGMVMPLSAERQAQARDLGLRIEGDPPRVYFPPDLVERALKAAPRRYRLYGRTPDNAFDLDGRHGYMCLDGCGTSVLDLNSGAVRRSTKADLRAAVRMADALPQISFLWPAIAAQDCSPKVQPLHELDAMFNNSSKHIQAMTAVDRLNAEGTVAMAAEVAGGSAALRERPLISTFLCSVSPLSYHENALDAAMVYGEAGVPTGFLCMPIACATAPATLAGAAALANAEVLAGIALFELFFPGVPTFYGSCATMMELRTGGITSGGPEDFLLQAAACQLAHFYDLPANIGTFATGAKASNWQAGVENAVSGAVSQLSGADMMCGAGQLNGARIFSFEQLLMDCEIYDMLRSVTQGFEVSEETLALETIDSTGPQNHYLTSQHTLDHMHEVWQPTVMDRISFEDWQDRNRPAPSDRARQLAANFLAPDQRPPESRRRRDTRNETMRQLDSYQPAPLACAGTLAEIIAEYEQK